MAGVYLVQEAAEFACSMSCGFLSRFGGLGT